MATTLGDRAFARKRLYNMKKMIIGEDHHLGYDTLNITNEAWEAWETEINNIDSIDFIINDVPIYFKLTDKEYIFDPKNPNRLRNDLTNALDHILKGAESVINAINDLNIKSAQTEENKKLVQRKMKLMEILIKSGKIKIDDLIK